MTWAPLLLTYLSVHLAAAQHHRRGIRVCGVRSDIWKQKGEIGHGPWTRAAALYPSAYRIKRETPSLVDPSFQRSVEDVNLLFEILLTGMQIEGRGRGMLIPDAELASLRCAKKLEVICDDVLPKKLSEIRRLTAELGRHRKPLSPRDFERTVLTLVYIAQKLAGVTDRQKRAAWRDSMIEVFKAIQKDLSPK